MNGRSFFALALAVALAGAAGLAPAAARAQIAPGEVRVRLLQGVTSARVEALAGGELWIEDAPEHHRDVTVRASAGRVRVGRLSSGDPVRIGARSGLSVAGKTLPGAVLVAPTGGARFDVINAVPLETYVERAVAGEVYADWPAEALKSQAVVTRTYALYYQRSRADAPFDVEASVISQRYRGAPAPASIRQAVAATRGEYLVFAGQPILAAFHSSSGGRTASAAEVWGGDLPYLGAVESPDDDSPDFFWSYEIDRGALVRELERAGHRVGGDPLEVAVIERSVTGRVKTLAVGEARLSGRELRQVLGGRAIRSALFDARLEGDTVRFLGSGAGHGVGMDQWGARELARRGKGYREILLHYYQGAAFAREPRAVGANAP